MFVAGGEAALLRHLQRRAAVPRRLTLPVRSPDDARQRQPIALTSQMPQAASEIVGKMFRFFAGAPRRRSFRVFDSIKHLRLPVNESSVICPSDRVDVEQLLAECERVAQREGVPLPDGIQGPNFSAPFFWTWKKAQRADVRHCEELRRRIDPAQCSWDASWLSDFEADWREHGEWSVRIWIRATPQSKGMPKGFWPTVHIFSSLAPALVLLDWCFALMLLPPAVMLLI